MPSFSPKNELVQNRQLKVQQLVIPFTITGNATPASVAITRDEPALLFLKTEGVNQITAALDTADGTPTLTAADDSDGIFNLMVKISEPVGKVMSARVQSRNAAAIVGCTLANTTGITAGGEKIVLNCDTAVDLSAANLDACLIVEYVVAE